ncbi:MAG: SpoIIE family protein phosphatase, partial [Bordetella sp.]|nr:SpoIIE family protein phosphatase [Bordetella sp.]
TLVATELATNLAKHARQGELLVAARDPFDDIELLCVDRGPGMDDVPRSMLDGVSTTATSGTGLGAIVRQSDFVDLHSAPGVGTVCVARVARGGRSSAARRLPTGPWTAFDFGAVCVPVRGESVCGDGWLVGYEGSQAAAMLADGLGHGPDAARAAQAAVSVFAENPFRDSAASLQEVHAALRTLRGAAVLALWVDTAEVRYAGAGNVTARLISGTADRTLATAHGTLGLQARRFDATCIARPPYATAVMHSDGVQSRWSAEAIAPLLARDPALLAARIYGDYSRGRDDVCVLALRPKEAA